MIKFYKDTYANLASLSGGENNICFATDRQVIILGGKEYGKDSLKVEAGERAYNFEPTGSRDFVSGTFVAFTNNNSLWQYNGNSSWTNVFVGTLNEADLALAKKADGTLSTSVSGDYQATIGDVIKVALEEEGKVSGAYLESTETIARANVAEASNFVVVSKPSGIARTTYKLDNGQVSATILNTNTAAADKTSINDTLVNAQTLAAVYEDVKSQAVTMAAEPTDFITWTSAGDYSGTTWTPSAHILTGAVSGALKNNAGTLEAHFAIRKLAQGDTGYDAGYRSQYALFNEAAGAKSVQIGDTINLVKDQFLKNVDYVIAWQDSTTNVWYEHDGSAWHATKADGTIDSAAQVPTNVPAKNAANRYMKFIFTLTRPETEGGTNVDEDSVVYINVNELFDSLSGINGVYVNADTNEVSAVINPATEVGYSASDKKGVKGTHYGATAYLTVGANGIDVTGIKKDISASIEDLDNSLAAGENTWMTSVGVENGRLTASYLSAYASGVNFTAINAVTGKDASARVAVTGTTVEGAINSISNTIAKLDYTYNGDSEGTTPGASKGTNNGTYFVYAITQEDGQIATSAKPLDSADLQVSAHVSENLAGINKKIYTVAQTEGTAGSLQAGLSTIVDSVYAAIDAMDLAQVGTTATFASYTNGGTQTAATIVNTISESDGKVTAEAISLDADHVVYTAPAASDGVASSLWLGKNAPGDTNYNTASTIGAALSSIGAYINSLDVATIGTVGSTVDDVSTAYQIINQIGQNDGKISAVTMELNAGNVAATAVAANLPDGNSPSIAPANVKVAVDGTNVKQQINDISNTIADYLSFHNGQGNVI